MATLAAARQFGLEREHRFFAGIAVAIVLVVFVGFAPSYYLSSMTAVPALVPLVHVHGLVFTLWVLVYAAQTALIATHRAAIHRSLGYSAIGLAVLVVGRGFVTAIVTASPVSIAGHIGPPIIFPFFAISMFGLLFTGGIAFRRRPQHHKRLMMLATLSLVVTPGARIGKMLGTTLPPPVFGMLLIDVLLVALVAFDLRTCGRLHAATLYGGGALLLSEPLRVVIATLPAWQAFAASIGAR